jgi:DNA-3-methyladenine glycosylase I
MSEPPPPKGLYRDLDGRCRCQWCRGDDGYRAYHDAEWGRPVTDDRRLFEKICLEGFQSGLSWLTILRKRENFRQAFANFDAEVVAGLGEDDVARLIADAGIIRHQGKIRSTINNARRALELTRDFGSFAAYVWRFEPHHTTRPERYDHASLSAFTTTAESIKLSKDLKKRGWSFVGPTTCYAFMQAMGLVNDHIEGCHIREEIEAARAIFVPPV